MPSPVFDLLASAVREGDSIRVTLTRNGGKLEALIVPALKDVKEDDSNTERAALLGALARPWKVDAAEGESIEQAITDSLHGSHDARESAKAALDELNAALSDAAARARTKATATKATPAKPAAPTGAKPAKKAPVKARVTAAEPPVTEDPPPAAAPPPASEPAAPAAPAVPVEASAGSATPSLFDPA